MAKINWEEIKIPTFKEIYGDFGGYILSKIRSGGDIESAGHTAQLQKNGFANSMKVLKNTRQTKIIVTAFHVPGKLGNIRHYDINLYKFVRKKPSDDLDWQQVKDFSLRENEVQELLAFLHEQNTILGISFNKNKFAKVLLSNENLDDIDLTKLTDIKNKLSPSQIEEIISSKEGVEIINNKLPKIRIDLLEKLVEDLSNLLDKGEKDVQGWIDKDPNNRCLIFGLEFVDYKRETQFGNSQFDVLSDISGTEHVIIELKSPNKEVFNIIEKKLKNGIKNEYILSSDLSEAIPQVIKYFREYERENSETFIKNGTKQKKVPKAIILIGRNKKDDPVWQENYCDLRSRISGIEILTYDHLIEKLENQIKNLKSLN